MPKHRAAYMLVIIIVCQSLLANAGYDANLLQETDTSLETPLNSTFAPVSLGPTTLFLQSRTSALQMGNGSTIRVLNHSVGNLDSTNSGSQSLQVTAFTDPVLRTAADLSGSVRFALWIRGSGGPNSKASIQFELNRADSNGTVFGAALATVTTNNVAFPTSYTEHVANATISTISLNPGERLHLSIDISGNNGITYTARWGTSLYQSRFELPVVSPVTAGSPDLTDANGSSVSRVWAGLTPSPVELSLPMSSPFGVEHFDSVEVDLVAPNGTVVATSNATSLDQPWQARGNWSVQYPFSSTSVFGNWLVRWRIDTLDASRWLADHPGDDTAGGYRLFVNSTLPVELPYQLDVDCVDADGNPLANLTLQISIDGVREPSRDSQCDAAGQASLDVPGAQVDLVALHQGVSVGSGSYIVNSNRSETLATNVSDLRINSTHADGRPAGEIVIWVVHPNGTLIESGRRFNGTLVLPSMAVGDYVVSASWMGNPLPMTIISHLGAAGGTNASIDTTVLTSIVRVFDRAGTPLSGVQLIARDQSSGAIRAAAVTLSDGRAAFDLMDGAYSLEPRWQQFSFSARVVTLNGSNVSIFLELERINATVISLNGEGLAAASIRILDADGGTLVLSDADEQGMSSLRLPNGTWYVAVQWSGRIFELGNQSVSGPTNWSLVLPIVKPLVQLSEVSNVSIEGARVEFTDSQGLNWTGEPTNSTGATHIRLPTGNLSVVVRIAGFVVHVANITVYSNTTSLDFVIDLPEAYVRVVTADGSPLDAVELKLMSQGGTLIDATLTDSNGTATLRAPNGEHVLTARWLGQEIGAQNLTIAGIVNVTMIAAVHPIAVLALDRSNNPVNEVTFLVRRASSDVILTTARTDNNGTARFLLPTGNYDLEATWFGILVLDTSISVFGPTNLTVGVDIVLAEIAVVDQQGLPVEDVRLDARRDGSFAGSETTGSDGRADFRLGAGQYTFTATWRGVEVGSDSFDIQPTASGSFVMQVNVSRTTVRVIDRDGLPVNGVTFSVRDGLVLIEQNTSGSDGMLDMRLPHGTFDATATLSGIIVAELGNFSVPTTGVLIVEVALERVDLRLLDLDGRPVEGAQVFARDPRTLGAAVAISDAAGIASLRLPEGNYTLEFAWRGRIIATENLTVPTTVLNRTLPLASHSITVRDMDGGIASGVFVSLRDSQDGIILADTLPSSGSLSALVGAGTHRLSVSWAGLSLLTEHYDPLNESNHNVTLPLRSMVITLVDLDGDILPGAGLVLRLETGQLLDVVTMNATGAAVLYMPQSTVTLSVQIQGNVVYTDYYTLPVTGGLEIIVPVRTVEFTLLDTSGGPVGGASTHVIASNGMRVGPGISNGIGQVTMFVLPGEVILEARWHERTVFAANITGASGSVNLTTDVHRVTPVILSPLAGLPITVRDLVAIDQATLLEWTVPPSGTIQIAGGPHTVRMTWQGVALAEVLFTVGGSEQVNLTAPLRVVDISFLDTQGGQLTISTAMTLAVGDWSTTLMVVDRLHIITPPGGMTLEVMLDDVLLRDAALAIDNGTVQLPLRHFDAGVVRSDGTHLEGARLEFSWPGLSWSDWPEEGVVGPTGLNWDARVFYSGWTFERQMSMDDETGEAYVLVEIIDITVHVIDRNGDPLAETACSLTGPEASAIVVTDVNGTVVAELLAGTYDWLCRVPSAGDVGQDGRRSSKEFEGRLSANLDATIKLEIVELPFSEQAQIEGIFSSGVGQTIVILGVVGWLGVLALANLLMRRRRGGGDSEPPAATPEQPADSWNDML